MFPEEQTQILRKVAVLWSLASTWKEGVGIKIILGKMNPFRKYNSVPSLHKTVQFPHYPTTTNSTMIAFVPTKLPCWSQPAFCLPVCFAPECKTRIIRLAFQRVLQSKQNSGCISLRKHFYHHFWNNIEVTISLET
jgi:hypothetical protein